VILTTFTDNAAADFRERARSVLYEEGLFEKAALLDQAEIGTVHSIAYDLIHRYWYLLGLSPEMNVMDEDSTNFYINQSLASLPTADDIKLFRRFQREFGLTHAEGLSYSRPYDNFWKDWLNEIISKKVSYRVDSLEESMAFSLNHLEDIFQPSVDFDLSPDRFLPIIEQIKDVATTDSTGKGAERLKKSQEFLSLYHWDIKDFVSLGGLLKDIPAKYHISDIDNAKAEINNLWHSHQVFELISSVVNRLFQLAQDWTAQYEQYKKERRIIDFNDMEKYMLDLLVNEQTKDAVSKELRGRYKVLMVDEFQDSSPIQVDIFNRLSELMEQTFWCGDSKQAIYGFRGTDTRLTEAVVGMIPEESVEILDTSYRSQPDLVTFSNRIFTKVFSGTLKSEKITLKAHRTKNIEGPNLIHWPSPYSKKDEFVASLANRVNDFIERYEVPFKDVAILARTNGELATMANALQEYGIPVNQGAGTLLSQKETELLCSILTLIVDDSNLLAKTKIVYLAEPDRKLKKLIDERLSYVERLSQDEELTDEWLNASPLVSQILKHRGDWADQSVSAQIESVMAELNLRGVVKRWGDWKNREANIYQIIKLAKQYEQYCQVMTLGSTTTGFLDYLGSREDEAAGSVDGVVLSTYHRAKGLEWPNVILLSLADNVIEEKQIISRSIFGVQYVRTAQPSKENLFPKMLISLMPWVFGKSTLPDDMRANVCDSVYFNDTRKNVLEESARLLYVGMTRARDRLITTSMKKKQPLCWASNLGLEVADIPTEGLVDLFGTGVFSEIENPIRPDGELPEQPLVRDYDIIIDGHDDSHYEQKYISPSASGRKDVSEVGTAEQISNRIPLRGKPDMDKVGTCIHNIFAACGENADLNTSKAANLVKSFGYEKVLPDISAILDARSALISYLEKQYGAKKNEYHELSFQHKIGSQIVRGSMDLVWETEQGCVLIDFKSFPGKEEDVVNPENSHYAGKYKPQFDYYRAALKESGKDVIGSYVFFPVNGILIEIK